MVVCNTNSQAATYFRPQLSREPKVDNRSEPNLSAQTLAKRAFVKVARTLRESELFYRLMVGAFRTFQRLGVSVCPNHYYWPVPDLSDLERRDWCIQAVPPGVDLQLEQQQTLAESIARVYGKECRFPNHANGDAHYHYNNGFFETVDAEIAYGLVREYKPRRVIEVGSGFSTRVLLAGLSANMRRDGVSGELVTVDPFPERVPKDGLGDKITVIPEPVQNLDLQLFQSLRSGDILFIDSSHVVGVGSDVVREFLEIIPSVQKGVLVHLHDIFLPSDYPREAVLNNLWFWSEQYLLQSFLSFNHSFEVLWASSAMQFFRPEVLERSFPRWKHSYREMPREKRRFIPSLDHDRVWPSSFWMRRV